MIVSELMTTPVLTVKTGASIADLLELFKGNHVSGVPVVDEDDHLVGIVSRQDIVLEELRLLGGSAPAQSTLDQIVGGGFVTVSGEGLKSRSQLVWEIMTEAKKLLRAANE